jgi:polyhydroxyalkanoate synthesis regulator phasin
MAKNTLQRLLDAGVQFGEMSRKQAERVVKQFVKAGAVRRSEAEASVQALLERSRETATAIGESVQREVTKQLGWLAKRVDELEDELESTLSRFNPLASSKEAPTASDAVKASAKRAPTKTTAVKRAPAKRAPAKKSAPKKAAAKKSPAKQAGARKIAGPSG